MFRTMLSRHGPKPPGGDSARAGSIHAGRTELKARGARIFRICHLQLCKNDELTPLSLLQSQLL